jgi:hypothetical protein
MLSLISEFSVPFPAEGRNAVSTASFFSKVLNLIPVSLKLLTEI